MISITKPNAFRAAAKICLEQGEVYFPFEGVLLMPDGALLAANEYVAIRSEAAHTGEIDDPILIHKSSLKGLNRSALSFGVDLGSTTLVEYGARSEGKRLLQAERVVANDIKALSSSVFTLKLHHDPASHGQMPPFDSIRAGAIAAAYGLRHGVWYPGIDDTVVSLSGLEEGDRIILAAMKI